MPTCSIIINNYNYERFLRAAVDSALAQTYPNVEVLVVDDCSTDSSREIIASYKNLIVPILRENNGKQAAALNVGFEKSTGEIVLFLDADDYLFPTAVEEISAAFQIGKDSEIGKVHFRLQVVDGENRSLGYHIPSVGMSLADGAVCHKLLQTSSYVSSPMSGNAYRRKTLCPIFPIPDEYKTTADDYLMISTPFHAGQLAGINESIGAYRVHNDNQWALTSVSGSRFRRFVNHDVQNFALLKQCARAFNQPIPENLERRSLGRIWSRLASLRLEPKEHPVSGDRVTRLVVWGILALWQFSSHNLPKRLIYTVLFLWVGFMPLPLAKLGITWLYAPHLRPKVIDTTLTRLRTLVS